MVATPKLTSNIYIYYYFYILKKKSGWFAFLTISCSLYIYRTMKQHCSVTQGFPYSFPGVNCRLREALRYSSGVALPESSCCPWGHVDFLLFGSTGTSAGCQAQLDGLVTRSVTLPLHQSLPFLSCFPAASLIFPSLALSLCSATWLVPCCCCNADDNRGTAASKPAAVYPQPAGAGWEAGYPDPPQGWLGVGKKEKDTGPNCMMV